MSCGTSQGTLCVEDNISNSGWEEGKESQWCRWEGVHLLGAPGRVEAEVIGNIQLFHLLWQEQGGKSAHLMPLTNGISTHFIY